jgi:hypothetical protein
MTREQPFGKPNRSGAAKRLASKNEARTEQRTREADGILRFCAMGRCLKAQAGRPAREMGRGMRRWNRNHSSAMALNARWRPESVGFIRPVRTISCVSSLDAFAMAAGTQCLAEQGFARPNDDGARRRLDRKTGSKRIESADFVLRIMRERCPLDQDWLLGVPRGAIMPDACWRRRSTSLRRLANSTSIFRECDWAAFDGLTVSRGATICVTS